MLRYAVALCLLALSCAQDCQVANIQVMQNFTKARVSKKYNTVLRYYFKSVLTSLGTPPLQLLYL